MSRRDIDIEQMLRVREEYGNINSAKQGKGIGK